MSEPKSTFELLDLIGQVLTKALRCDGRIFPVSEDELLQAKDAVNKLKGQESKVNA
jgi:hypothetical protein